MPVQTKFFKKSSDNLGEYKNNFKKALQKIKIVKLFDNNVIEFLEKWIDSQKSYIPREDVDNLWKNMEMIYKDKDFYDYVVKGLNQVKNNWNILEYSFNLISKFDELAKKYSEYKKKKDFEEKLEKEKIEARKKEEEEMKKLLEDL